MAEPMQFRTSDGKVRHNRSWLSLNNGVYWWDIGCPIMSEIEAQSLPVYDGPLDKELPAGIYVSSGTPPHHWLK